MNQEKRNFESFVKLFLDSTNVRIDNIMKDVLDIKKTHFSQKDFDDLNKRVSDYESPQSERHLE